MASLFTLDASLQIWTWSRGRHSQGSGQCCLSLILLFLNFQVPVIEHRLSHPQHLV
jgi:hypothetical protein